MAGAIFYMNDQFPVLLFLRPHLLEDVAYRIDDFNVLLFIVAADVISFAKLTLFYDFIQSASVIFYIEPVTDLLAFAVERKGLAFQRVENDKGYKLLWKVEGAIIVGAVGQQHGQPIGPMPGANEMI